MNDSHCPVHLDFALFRLFVCCSFTHTSCFFFHSLLFLVVLYYPQCFRHEHGCTTSSSLLLHLTHSFFAPFFHLPAFMIFHGCINNKKEWILPQKQENHSKTILCLPFLIRR
ncbi:hypothetical protein F5H01DRAFT_201230 [Linnemannia elongata]|nr:hypothetical protein F5H01DRAFT_201230 [Linnemannia elongata]